VSDRLKQSLMSSRNEIEAGLAEAEAELVRTRQRMRELEELIALGTATLLAAEMISGGNRSSAPAAQSGGSGTAAQDLTTAHEKSKDELQSRLQKQK